MVGREMEYNQKAILQEKWYRQEKSMLRWLHHRYSEFSEQLGIIDGIGKYLLMERMAFLSILNICFHEAQYFLRHLPEFFNYNNILITMNKHTFLNLDTFQSKL